MPSRRLLLALTLAALVALEVYVLAFMPIARVGSMGRHVTAITEFGTGAVVSQSLVAEADGLHAIQIGLQADHASDVEIEWALRVKRGGAGFQDWHRGTLVAHGVSGTRWQTLEFPTIDTSTGATVALELRDRRSSGDAARPIALLASRDRPLRHSVLSVDGQERWGSLRFDTRSDADTVLGRLRLRRVPYLWLVLALYNLLMASVVIAVWRADGARHLQAAGTSRLASVTLIGLLAAALAAGAWIVRVDGGRVDLIDELYAADLQSPMALHDAFDVLETEIGTEQKRAILAHAPSEITMRVNVPRRATFHADIALHGGAWALDNDGVVFRVAVAEPSTSLGPGGPPVELFMRHVNASHIAADRRWIPVDIDLRGFAGKTIDLVLTTEPSLPGYPVNTGYDWALWAGPKIK